jgi:hypothetical protein
MKESNLTANHPTYYGNGFTVRRREHSPNLSHTLLNVSYKTNCIAMQPQPTSGVGGNQFALYATIFIPQEELPSGRPPVCPMFKVRGPDLVSGILHTTQAPYQYACDFVLLTVVV